MAGMLDQMQAAGQRFVHVENLQRAMQATPVKNENGVAIGKFRYNGAVAKVWLALHMTRFIAGSCGS